MLISIKGLSSEERQNLLREQEDILERKLKKFEGDKSGGGSGDYQGRNIVDSYMRWLAQSDKVKSLKQRILRSERYYKNK